MAPKDIIKKNETQIWVNLYWKRPSHKQRKRSKFNLGDLRLTIEKAFLMNRYQEIWTNELFIIEAIVYGNPTTHKIKYQDNEPTKGATYQQKSFSWLWNSRRIEKLVQKKKEADRVLLYVKWQGYPDNLNSYVFQGKVESLFTLCYLATATWIFTP